MTDSKPTSSIRSGRQQRLLQGLQKLQDSSRDRSRVWQHFRDSAEPLTAWKGYWQSLVDYERGLRARQASARRLLTTHGTERPLSRELLDLLETLRRESDTLDTTCSLWQRQWSIDELKRLSKALKRLSTSLDSAYDELDAREKIPSPPSESSSSSPASSGSRQYIWNKNLPPSERLTHDDLTDKLLE